MGGGRRPPVRSEGSDIVKEIEFEAVVPPATGTASVVTIDDVAVALVEAGGQLRAFDDTCTHRGCSLAEGTVDAISVTCPCHHGRFDLSSGIPLDGPPTEAIRVRIVRRDGDRVLVER
jgi:nitrite reductase/ring-hydroxylating ferredoxin subunit